MLVELEKRSCRGEGNRPRWVGSHDFGTHQDGTQKRPNRQRPLLVLGNGQTVKG